MLRKILIAIVASLSLMSPLAVPAETQAHPPSHYPLDHRRPHHDRDYRLYVREYSQHHWRYVGTYERYDDAFHSSRFYRMRGYEISIRPY